jgi:predicted Mrr-cat superfamily restriction endonuclease
VSDDFIKGNFAGPGWSENDAPELHQFIRSLKVGDVVYIKSNPANSPNITIKAIGIITNDEILSKKDNQLIGAARNIRWIRTDSFAIKKPKEKNNVRLNTMYEEFHPAIQSEIIEKLFEKLSPKKAP